MQVQRQQSGAIQGKQFLLRVIIAVVAAVITKANPRGINFLQHIGQVTVVPQVFQRNIDPKQLRHLRYGFHPVQP